MWYIAQFVKDAYMIVRTELFHYHDIIDPKIYIVCV